jgi:AraC-like DNA-binding protein
MFQPRVPLFGHRVATVRSERAQLAEHEYPAGLCAAPHVHEHSYLTLIIAGSTAERFSNRAEQLVRGDLQFMRAGEVHSNHYPIATRCLHGAPPWLTRVRDALHASYRQKPSLDQLAQIAGVVPEHISREFHRYTGRTVGTYVRDLRIVYACRLLETSAATLAEIALDCGFADQSHFASTFRRTMGITPGLYRSRRR